MDQSLARRALRGALEVRKKAGLSLSLPICIYDLAGETLKVKVRFQAGPSFGGMYAKETQTILVPSERPAGRRAFTCAHELGHWYFKHGTRLEDLIEQDKGSSDDPDEILVDQFAANLLMPKWAMEQLVKSSPVDINAASEIQLYAAACQFGVGYETIINHLRYGLGFIRASTSDRLLQSTPKNIKQALLGTSFPNHLVLVTKNWNTVPIDLEVGDGVFLDFPVKADGSNLIKGDSKLGTLLIATRSGITKVEALSDKWAAFVRISRKGYTGRSTFRHLEDPDE